MSPDHRRERNRRMGVIREHQKNPGYYSPRPEVVLNAPLAALFTGVGVVIGMMIGVAI